MVYFYDYCGWYAVNQQDSVNCINSTCQFTNWEDTGFCIYSRSRKFLLKKKLRRKRISSALFFIERFSKDFESINVLFDNVGPLLKHFIIYNIIYNISVLETLTNEFYFYCRKWKWIYKPLWLQRNMTKMTEIFWYFLFYLDMRTDKILYWM